MFLELVFREATRASGKVIGKFIVKQVVTSVVASSTLAFLRDASGKAKKTL